MMSTIQFAASQHSALYIPDVLQLRIDLVYRYLECSKGG
jgi:hypothetical protein